MLTTFTPMEKRKMDSSANSLKEDSVFILWDDLYLSSTVCLLDAEFDPTWKVGIIECWII